LSFGITSSWGSKAVAINEDFPEVFMNKFGNAGVLSVAIAGLLFAGVAQADRDDIRLLAETKISLADAIAVAEKHQNGRAYEAGIDDDSFSPMYEVSVVTADERMYELDVDAVTGEVSNVREEND
jgi:uncharacterized membrane protein YkoI